MSPPVQIVKNRFFSSVYLYSSVELVLHLYMLRDVLMLRKKVTSNEFLTINREVKVKFYRREVSKVNRQRAEVVDKWRGVTVFQEPHLTLSRTGSKWSFYTIMSGVSVSRGIQLYSASCRSGFTTTPSKFYIILQFSSSLAGQNLFLWGVVWTLNMQIGQ
jgi:hypothetical protein